MLANFGYKDGSGEFFIEVDTDKCNGCGNCVSNCPAGLLKVVEENPFDPLEEGPLVIVIDEKIKKLKYECGPCKSKGESFPCLRDCLAKAISHSW